MNVNTLTLNSPLFPAQLKTITNPPAQLHYLGDLDKALQGPRLAIVGSRKVSTYGKAVTLKLAREAAEQGITIVSGLALGVDGLAHQAALDSGGNTVAVLRGIEKIQPATHQQLAERILQSGGALVSEFSGSGMVFKGDFVTRNRIVSGISDAVLVTEAAIGSGSLHTTTFAQKQGRTVLAIPGNITSELSAGTNNLIKQGAIPVTEIRDILAAMNLQKTTKKLQVVGSTDEETVVLQLIAKGMSDASELLHHSKLAPPVFNQTLTMLEITGKIHPLGSGKWSIV